jgi:hypothetical protein
METADFSTAHERRHGRINALLSFLSQLAQVTSTITRPFIAIQRRSAHATSPADLYAHVHNKLHTHLHMQLDPYVPAARTTRSNGHDLQLACS